MSKLNRVMTKCAFLTVVFAASVLVAQDDPHKLLADGQTITADRIVALCRELIPPAGRGGDTPGDDTAIREALHGLALRAGQPDAGALRTSALQAFNTALQSDSPVPVKAYLLEQLRFFADASSIPVLGGLLATPELCDPAARVLVTVGTPAAAAALRQALSTASAVEQQIVLVQAVGDMGDPGSAPMVQPLLKHADKKLRMAAVTALGRCGSAANAAALSTAMGSESAYERARALAAYMNLLSRRHAGGDAAAESECLAFMAARPDDMHVQCAGLEFLARVGSKRALDAIASRFPSDVPRIRATALRLAARVENGAMTGKVVAALGGATPELTVELLGVLAMRGDRSALPEIRAKLRDENSGVRGGAVRAFATLGGQDKISELVPLLDTAEKGDRRVLEQVLVEMAGADVSSALAAMLDNADEERSCSLLSVLGRRGAREQFALVAKAAENTSESVRAAALRAAGQLASIDGFSQLVQLVVAVEGSKARRAGEDGLISCLRRIGVSDQTVTIVLGKLAGAPTAGRVSLLRVLGTTGHSQALAAIRNDIKHSDQAVTDGAVRALADWPKTEALDPLQTVMEGAENETHKILALRGYVRLLAKAKKMPADERLAKYLAVMSLAGRDAERKLVVGGIGTVKTRKALDVLVPYLDQPTLRAEAAAAVVAVAESVRGAAATVAVRRALADDVKAGKKLRARAKKLLDELEKNAGCVTHWGLSGPYKKAKVSGHKLGDVAFGPELADAEGVEWRQVTTAADGRINLSKVVGGSNRAVYLRCEMVVPEVTKVRMDLGSDDGVIAWLNGKVVHKNNVPRSFKWGEDQVNLDLAKGRNTLMLKIMQGGGGWEANARIRNVDGSVLTGLELK